VLLLERILNCLSIKEIAERLWFSEMMTCLRDAVPDYAAKVQSLVLSGGLSQIEHLDTDSVLDVWGNKWIACWRDLPDNPRALSMSKCLMLHMIHGCLIAFHSLLHMSIMAVASSQSIWLILCDS
jgi:hypothetical protein